MAVRENIFFDGFDVYAAIADMGEDYSFPSADSVSFQALGGMRAIRIGGAGNMHRLLGDDYDYVCAGVRMEFTGATIANGAPYFAIRDGATTSRVRLQASGTAGDIAVIAGASTTLFTITAGYNPASPEYYEIEAYRHATDGFVGVRRNGTLIGSFSGDTTAIGGTMARVVCQVAGGFLAVYRDLYCFGVTGIIAEDPVIGTMCLGNCRVREKPWTSTVSDQFTRSTGADSHATIDEMPANGDTDYNESATDGHQDRFAHDGLADEGNIVALGVSVTARKSAAGTMQLVAELHSDAESEIEAFLPGDAFRTTLRCVRQTDPDDDEPWDYTRANALEGGYRNEAA